MKQNSLKINGDSINYLEQGSGNTVVFLHGMPTSSFLWRNIIPELAAHQVRCIAPDLIGMGQSDSPDIDYSITDHVDYFVKFMRSLDLKNVVLVMHGFGSIIGLEYAKLHSSNVRGLVLFESHLKPFFTKDLSLPLQELIYKLLLADDLEKQVMKNNIIVKTFFNSGVLTKLPEKILMEYQKPFLKESNRGVLFKYITEILNLNNSNVINTIIGGYQKFLSTTAIPKCLLYATPGMFTSIETVMWAKNNLKNIETFDLGNSLHFAQETCPFVFSESLVTWYLKTYNHE
jgi:haloalkane dehalogenase